jgi:hypothetical protein
MSSAGGSSLTDPGHSCESTKAVPFSDSRVPSSQSEAVPFRGGIEEDGVATIDGLCFEVGTRPVRKVICQSVMVDGRSA